LKGVPPKPPGVIPAQSLKGQEGQVLIPKGEKNVQQQWKNKKRNRGGTIKRRKHLKRGTVAANAKKGQKNFT